MQNITYETIRYPGKVKSSPPYRDCKSAFEELLRDKDAYGIRLGHRNENNNGDSNPLCLMSYEKLRQPTSETPIIYRTYIYGYEKQEVITLFSIVSIVFLIILILLYYLFRKKLKK